MKAIDIHTHILPPEIPKFRDQFGYGGFIEYRRDLGHSESGCRHVDMYYDSGSFFRHVKPNAFDAKERLKECDACAVQLQVLSTVPVMFSYWAKPRDGLYVSQFLNDHLAKVISEHPARFLGLATVPMQDAKLAVKEAKRAKETLGLTGFQIGSNINRINLSDPQFFPFYEACEAMNAPIFVHPWDMMGKKEMPQYWLPWLVGMPAETSRAICSLIFGGVMSRFPKLRFAFAHGGGSFAMTHGRIAHGFQMRPDLCATECAENPDHFIGHFFVDSLVHDVETLRFIVQLFGASRVCLGSDYPFPLGEIKPGELIRSGEFTKEVEEQLLTLSALEWLGIDVLP